jgi:pimeloyl-ACP methyl ester carboxylesterase
MVEPGALSAALAWYRAARPRHVRDAGAVDVPTLYVWSTGDAALGYDAARRTERWVRGPYRFEVLPEVSHWIQRETPDRLFSLLTEHLTRHGDSLGTLDAEAVLPPSGGQRA